MQKISLAAAAQQISQQRQTFVQRKKRLQGEEARYTLILHSARKQLDISINEYCLADTIHKLSSNRSIVPGWCHASKDHLARSLGISRQSIHNIINRLTKAGLVEAQAETGHLRTTDTWRDAVEVLRSKVFGD